MNIFYLDKDPKEAAKHQYNKHIVKMILESAQMLCTAHWYYESEKVPYKPTHINHPSNVWVRENALHYLWLYNHFIALGEEYTKRYKKEHLTIQKCKDILSHIPMGMPYKTFTQPPQAMPDEYKADCSVEAYWNYYTKGKTHIANKDEKVLTKKPIEL